MAIVRVLNRITADYLYSFEYNNKKRFKHPEWTEETGPVKVSFPDWNPDPESKAGIFAVTKENCNYTIGEISPMDSMIWTVIEVDDNPDNMVIVQNGDCIKFKEGNIIYQGDDCNKAIRMVFDDEKSLLKLMHSNSHHIRFVDIDIDYEMAKKLLSGNGNIILYILVNKPDLIDYNLCELAVNNHGSAIGDILGFRSELIDYKLCKLALSTCGGAIEHILGCRPDLVDYGLAKIAINTNSWCIGEIIRRRPDLIDYKLAKTAISTNHCAINHILKHKPNLVDYNLAMFTATRSNHLMQGLRQYRPDLITHELRVTSAYYELSILDAPSRKSFIERNPDLNLVDPSI